MKAYLPVGIFFLETVVLVLLMMGIAVLMRKRGEKNTERVRNYECGEIPEGSARIRFHAGYYLVALVFILFDVEALFLFPWAITLKHLGILAFVEMFLFVMMLFLGWIYAYKKGALEWR